MTPLKCDINYINIGKYTIIKIIYYFWTDRHVYCNNCLYAKLTTSEWQKIAITCELVKKMDKNLNE